MPPSGKIRENIGSPQNFAQMWVDGQDMLRTTSKLMTNLYVYSLIQNTELYVDITFKSYLMSLF
jgi:hypothetical protein